MKLIDLHSPWLCQYAGESTIFRAARRPAHARLARLDGYLQSVSIAVLVCSAWDEDWASHPDPMALISTLITRYAAEFPGRLLKDPQDGGRQERLPGSGLAYGILAVGGLGSLVREVEHLDRLSRLFERGIRVFQIAESLPRQAVDSRLREDDGFTQLGFDLLAYLAAMPAASGTGRPILDLAGLPQSAIAQALEWRSANPQRCHSLPTMISHLALNDPLLEDESILTLARSQGVVIGLEPSPVPDGDEQMPARIIHRLAQIPFEGKTGIAGITLGSNLFLSDAPPKSLASAEGILHYLEASFDPSSGRELAETAAANLFLRAGLLAR